MKALPIDSYLKFTSTTLGRDKIYRTIQYFCRFLAYALAQRGHSKTAVQRLVQLSVSVGTARKLFRIGKPLDHLQAILKSAAIKDEVLRVCAIGKSTGLGFWLCLDTIQWLQAQQVLHLSPASAQRIQKWAALGWACGLAFSVLADLHRFRSHEIQKRWASRAGDASALKFHAKEQIKTAADLVQDSFDLVIPLSTLEYAHFSAGTVGLVGTFTSLLGAWANWPPSKPRIE